MAENGHVLFIWSAGGYRLEERDGEPPAPGARVTVADAAYAVQKVGASPLPGDHRPCAFLLAEP